MSLTMILVFGGRSEPPKATPLASELREPPPADSPLRPVRAHGFEKDADDAQAELARKPPPPTRFAPALKGGGDASWGILCIIPCSI